MNLKTQLCHREGQLNPKYSISLQQRSVKPKKFSHGRSVDTRNADISQCRSVEPRNSISSQGIQNLNYATEGLLNLETQSSH